MFYKHIFASYNRKIIFLILKQLEFYIWKQLELFLVSSFETIPITIKTFCFENMFFVGIIFFFLLRNIKYNIT